MKRKSKIFVGTIFTFFLMVAFIPVSSQAVDNRYWTGLSSPPNILWSDSGNWDVFGGGGVPLASQYAIINTGASVTYNYNYLSTGKLSGLTLDKGSSLSHDSGTTLTLDGPLLLGYTAGKTGTYELSNGTLFLTDSANGYGIAVGYDGIGYFNQNGGTNTVTNGMALGRNTGSQGTYNLNAGDLHILCQGLNGGEGVGKSGTGIFNQWGGTHTIDLGMSVGALSGSNGTYNLYAGSLSVGSGEAVGNFGTGTFYQTGGTNTVTQYLILGFNSGSQGTYNLSAGNLTANVGVTIGQSGTGTFNLSGTGNLSAGSETVGQSGTGFFYQSGGTNTIINSLNIGGQPGSHGTYKFSGGTLNANLNNNATGTTELSGGGPLAINGYVNNWGLFKVMDTTTAVVSGLFTNKSGGTIMGTGTIKGNVENYGTVSPGSSPGTLTIDGNFVQEAAGWLEIELQGYAQGTGYDYLNISGSATLSGSLDVDLLFLFDPIVGSIFNILHANGGLTGAFTGWYLPTLSGSKYFDIAYNYSLGNVYLKVLQGGTTVPEPATLILLGFGVAALGFARRRFSH